MCLRHAHTLVHRDQSADFLAILKVILKMDMMNDADGDDDDEHGYDVALHVVRRCGPPRPRRTDEVGMRCALANPGG